MAADVKPGCIPPKDEILRALDRLDVEFADGLESQWLEFKPWRSPKESMRVAAEYAACFANAEGGAIVFGVADKVRGRQRAIHGVCHHDVDTWRRGIFDSTRPNLDVSVEEVLVPEGTGRLLVVTVPRGASPPYGTARGLYTKRVGKNCMPLAPAALLRDQLPMRAVDWSGLAADGVRVRDLNAVELSRARDILRSVAPESDLLEVEDGEFLRGLGAVRDGKVTRAGLLLFGSDALLAEACPQHQVHYVYEVSDTAVARNDLCRGGLLKILRQVEDAFSGPANPEQELAVGLFRLRVPAFPIEVVREAVLNALTHRDYCDPNDVLIRHTARELTVVSPGGFVGNIRPDNILRCEPMSRNRTLAEAFQKLRLVERAGIGRRRIFRTLLAYGKRVPRYETDGQRVILRVFDGFLDERMARLVARWQQTSRAVDLDALLVLSYLRDNAYIDTRSAADTLQLPQQRAKGVLDRLAQPKAGILERLGKTRAATYSLNKAVARDLLGKAAYTRTRGVDRIRYEEMVKAFVAHHGSITPHECRELLGLGESRSARSQISRQLRKWCGSNGFLRREGKGPKTRYLPAQAKNGPGC